MYECHKVCSQGYSLHFYLIFVHFMVVCWLGFLSWGLGVLRFWGWGCSVDGIWCLWYVAFLFFFLLLGSLLKHRRTNMGKGLEEWWWFCHLDHACTPNQHSLLTKANQGQVRALYRHFPFVLFTYNVRAAQRRDSLPGRICGTCYQPERCLNERW